MTGTERRDAGPASPGRPTGRAARVAGSSRALAGQLSLLPGCLSEQDRAVLVFASAHHLQGWADDRAMPELGVSATRYYQLLARLLDRPEAVDAAPVLVGRLRVLRDQRRRLRDNHDRPGRFDQP